MVTLKPASLKPTPFVMKRRDRVADHVPTVSDVEIGKTRFVVLGRHSKNKISEKAASSRCDVRQR